MLGDVRARRSFNKLGAVRVGLASTVTVTVINGFRPERFCACFTRVFVPASPAFLCLFHPRFCACFACVLTKEPTERAKDLTQTMTNLNLTWPAYAWATLIGVVSFGLLCAMMRGLSRTSALSWLGRALVPGSPYFCSGVTLLAGLECVFVARWAGISAITLGLNLTFGLTLVLVAVTAIVLIVASKKRRWYGFELLRLASSGLAYVCLRIASDASASAGWIDTPGALILASLVTGNGYALLLHTYLGRMYRVALRRAKPDLRSIARYALVRTDGHAAYYAVQIYRTYALTLGVAGVLQLAMPSALAWVIGTCGAWCTMRLVVISLISPMYARGFNSIAPSLLAHYIDTRAYPAVHLAYVSVGQRKPRPRTLATYIYGNPTYGLLALRMVLLLLLAVY